jgi:hypothetical protein
MRHRKKGRELSRTRSHKLATLRNMATSLFLHERIRTTEAKAKELRPFAERDGVIWRAVVVPAGTWPTGRFSRSCSMRSDPVTGTAMVVILES